MRKAGCEVQTSYLERLIDLRRTTVGKLVSVLMSIMLVLTMTNIMSTLAYATSAEDDVQQEESADIAQNGDLESKGDSGESDSGEGVAAAEEEEPEVVVPETEGDAGQEDTLSLASILYDAYGIQTNGMMNDSAEEPRIILTFAVAGAVSHEHPLGHSDHVDEVPATCTHVGYSAKWYGYIYYCGQCNTYIVSQYAKEIPMLDHTKGEDPAVDSTCTKTGLTAGSHCTVCNKVLEAQEEIAVNPENHANVVVDPAVPATHTTTGLTEGSHCEDCGKVLKKQETVPRVVYEITSVDRFYDAVYNGSEQKLAPVVKAINENGEIIELSPDDYTVSYSGDMKNVTENGVTVTVTGKDENACTGTIEAKYCITPKEASITALALSKTYGDPDPELKAEVNGFVGGESANYEIVRQVGENAFKGSDNKGPKYLIQVRLKGEYTKVDQHTYIQGNYKITVKDNFLTIYPRPVTVKTQKASKVYGDDDPEFKAVVDGVLDGETVDYRLYRKSGESAIKGDSGQGNRYVIFIDVPGDPVAGEKDTVIQGNYKVTYSRAAFTINPKNILVKGINSSKQYGEDDPELAVVEGLVGDDTIEYSAVREAGEDVGKYSIGVTGAREQGNYIVDYSDGELTISAIDRPADDDVVVENYEGVYDGSAHGVSIANVGADDMVMYSTDGETWSTDAPEFINVVDGAQVLVKVSNKNYVDKVYEASVSVAPRPVVVAVESATKSEGDDDPEYVVSIDGVIGNDAIDYEVSRADGESAGTYPIAVTGAEQQGNYSVSFVPGELTIEAALVAPVEPTTPDNPTLNPAPANPINPGDATGGAAGTTGGAAAATNTTAGTVAGAPTDAAAPAALADGAAGAVIPDDATPLADAAGAAPVDQIDDEANPLAPGVELTPECWVHWLMILGILITIGYGAMTIIARRKEIEEIEAMENRALGHRRVSAATQTRTQKI